MRIGIDARVMSVRSGGIGRYMLEMVRSMAAREKARDHEFILYPGKDIDSVDLPDNWRCSQRRLTSRGILRSLSYPSLAREDRLDAFYSADYLGPVLPMPCRTVITVHDLIPIVYPRVTRFQHRLVGSFLLPRTIKNATAVVSVSKATKQDILMHIRIPQSRIKVIYEGKNEAFHPRDRHDSGIRDIRSRYGIGDGDDPYFLSLGISDPKKNGKNIVRAFSEIVKRPGNRCMLVLAGNTGHGASDLERMANELRIQDRVLFPGFVPDEHLPLLMNGARGLCFPSLYEGFGLPVLEAMACGCPVITSNVSSLPEIAGNAALLVDPGSVKQLTHAMERLLKEDELYDDLRVRGITRAEGFSWEQAAEELLDLLTAADR